METLGTVYELYAKHVCKVAAKSIKPFSRKVERRKQVPQQEQEQQQQQQQSGVSYRAATKVAANKSHKYKVNF